MNSLNCPYCKNRLGNFYYADACPHCHRELVQNTRILVVAPPVVTLPRTEWPFRLARRIVRLIES